jgi:sarcosine oxidase subunit alpha
MGWTPNTGLAYQAGVKFGYDDSRAELTVNNVPDNFVIAGRAAGAHVLEHEIAEGALAGRRMAASAGYGAKPSDADWMRVQEDKQAEPVRSSQRTVVKGSGKRFLCYCEDVTDKDLDTAVTEGFDSIELLKRYSTISMGPCQGKMCSMNTVHLCARANTSTVDETGSTTARPPMTPISLGALAGQNMEPVRITPVHDWHLRHSPKMMVAGLWLRPEHYGDPDGEVRAVRERVGVIDVSTLGKYKLTGTSVPNVLEKIYINRWHKLAVGRVRYGAMCNVEGIIMDDGVTAHVDETEWYMTTTSGGASSVYEWMQWWMQSGWGEGVQLVNCTDDFAAFNLAGPQARTLLEEITDVELRDRDFPYMHTRSGTVAGVPCRLLRIGFTGELSYELHCPASYGHHLWEILLATGEKFGIMPFGVEAQRVLRLEKGHLIIGQDTDALSNPIAAELGWAVKLEKDDFLGQRSLLRVSEQGVQQRLVGFKVPGAVSAPEEGMQIVRLSSNRKRPEIIGWVSSCRYSPTLNEVIGLCWLPTEIAGNDGAQFKIWRNERPLDARVHHGAFYDPDGMRLRG